MKYAQLVMGSAGTGKSTYCDAIQQHCAAKGRTVRVANFDPAAEHFRYPVAFDIRDLISVDDVQAEMQFGPNGALIFCMEYLIENLSWLTDHADSFLDDDYLLIDCPGQIELYSHIPVMSRVAESLEASGFRLCAVYLLDATFVTDAAKLIAGNLTALAAMVHLELPHINILSKCDLVDRAALDRYLSPSGESLAAELSRSTGPRFQRLNKAIARLLDDYDMVGFVPLDITDEESLDIVLQHVDHAMQYGEDLEPKEPRDDDGGGAEGGAGGGRGGAIPEGDEAEGGQGEGDTDGWG